MKRKQIIAYSAIGVGGLLVLAAAAMLVRSILQYREQEQAFNRLRSRLTQLYRAEVFPSEENVTLERENREQLEGWFEDLLAELGKENISRDDRSPSQFIGRLERTRNTLRQQADRDRIRLPEAGTNFAFGFERYAGTGLLPSPDDVPRLTEQLIIATRLTRILYDSEITSLRAIQRDVFEETTTPEQPREPTVTRRGAAPAPRRGPDTRQPVRAARQPGIRGEGDMFATYRFTLEFDAREEALARFLNALASTPMYTVVRTVRLRKEVPEMVVTSTAAATATTERRAGVDADVAFLFGGEEPVGTPTDPSAEPALGAALVGTSRPVSGIEMETPMQVRLEVDVYKFRSVDETRD